MALYNYILLLLLISAHGSVLMGGFGPPIDPSTPAVKAIYDFLILQIPSLSGWTIAEVRSQVVSGRNYQFSLTRDKDTAVVKVYQPLDHSLSITYFSINSEQKTIPELKPSELSPPAVVQKQPDSLVAALFGQSVSGSEMEPNITEINLLGNFDLKPFILLVPQETEIDKIWGYVSTQYPNLSSFEVKEVWKSENMGSVLLIVSQSSSKDIIVIFKVVIPSNNAYTVEILQTNSAAGFTPKEISVFRDKCYEQRPELSKFLISSISNGQSNSTLKFFFTQQKYYFIAFGYYEGAEQKIKFQD